MPTFQVMCSYSYSKSLVIHVRKDWAQEKAHGEMWSRHVLLLPNHWDSVIWRMWRSLLSVGSLVWILRTSETLYHLLPPWREWQPGCRNIGRVELPTAGMILWLTWVVISHHRIGKPCKCSSGQWNGSSQFSSCSVINHGCFIACKSFRIAVLILLCSGRQWVLRSSTSNIHITT